MLRLNTNISNHKNTKRKKRTQKFVWLYPSLKDDYLKRQDVQEAFARLICKAYVIQKHLLYRSVVSTKLWNINRKVFEKRLEKVIDFTGDENDYVVFRGDL